MECLPRVARVRPVAHIRRLVWLLSHGNFFALVGLFPLIRICTARPPLKSRVCFQTVSAAGFCVFEHLGDFSHWYAVPCLFLTWRVAHHRARLP